MRAADAGRLLPLLLLGAAAACGTAARRDDPLKNTKKLIVEGHVSLYENGAFRVPHTTISLIPAGPSALDLAGELMGVRARQSFTLSVERAAQSVTVVSVGTKRTFRAAKGIKAGGDADADLINRYVSGNGVLLVDRSSALGKRIVGESWDSAKAALAAAKSTGDAVARGAGDAGGRIGEAGAREGREFAANALGAARAISSEGIARSTAAFAYAANRFVRGYAAVPANMRKRVREAGERLTEANLGGIAREENETRARRSQRSVDLMAGAVDGYGAAVAEDFKKAGREFAGGYRTTGVSLAALKSMRWVLQGLLGDAVIVPAAKATAASLGYLGVNLVAFPSMVVVREGAAVTKLAVEANWDAARGAYDLTAPTGAAALAGAYGLAAGLGSQALAGAAAGGIAAGWAEAALARTAEVAVKGAGYGAGKTVRYIGVPLESAGIALGGGTVGTVVGGAGAASGGALYVTGEAGSAAARAVGTAAAGAALAGGTAVSAAGGAAYGVYELSKAVIVPPGYELAGGIVLDYGTMSHLAAQSILAVADCSYLVLSLEGPRWVLYAVKGKTGDGADLPAGAVVDLRKMQEAGEEIYEVPQTKEELKTLVDSAYGGLPELQAP